MGIPEKGNPSRTEALQGEIQEGFDELGKLPSRLDRYAVAKQRALVNLAHLQQRLNGMPETPMQMHLEKVQARLKVCGNYLGFRHYYTIGQVKLTAARFCMAHLLCPLCAIRRGSKMVQCYVDRYNVVVAENPGLQMSMITFTVKNGPDLKERMKHLKKSLQRLMKRSRDYKTIGRGYTEFVKVLGLVGTYEVTNKGNGWHPHAHLMVLHRERINAAALKREWQAITGDSHVLRIDPARNPNDPGQDFLEVCKYALKFGDLTPEQNLHAYEVLRGQRLVISAGLFWGVKIPEKLEDDISELEGLPYFEMLYKYVAGSGFNYTTKAEL